MKKIIALAVFGIGMFAGTAAYAQSAETPAVSPEKTQQVIAAIPSLQSIRQEIADFEAKTSGQQEKFENGNADLRALKMKYANELKTQIAANQGKPEVVEVLTAELAKTNAEIEKLK